MDTTQSGFQRVFRHFGGIEQALLFLLFAFPRFLGTLDTVRKSWYPLANWAYHLGSDAVEVVKSLEQRGLEPKSHYSKCIEGMFPPDLEEPPQAMVASTVLQIPKPTKRLKRDKVGKDIFCIPTIMWWNKRETTWGGALAMNRH